MIVYDVATKVLDAEVFPLQNIADLISGITFIVLFSQVKSFTVKENKHKDNHPTTTHPHTHIHTNTLCIYAHTQTHNTHTAHTLKHKYTHTHRHAITNAPL